MNQRQDLPGFGDQETWGLFRYAVGSPEYSEIKEDTFESQINDLENIMIDLQNAYTALEDNNYNQYKINLLSAQYQIKMLVDEAEYITEQ